MSKESLFQILHLRAARQNTIEETLKAIKENMYLSFTLREQYDIIRTISGVKTSWDNSYQIKNMDTFLSNLEWHKQNNLEWIETLTEKRDQYKINTIQYNKHNAKINDLIQENINIDRQLETHRTLSDLKADDFAQRGMHKGFNHYIKDLVRGY